MTHSSSWFGKLALVTGASSGIGAAAARRFARGGLRLALTARRQDRLADLAASLAASGAQVEVFPADLSDPAGRSALIDQVQSRCGGVDVLVNNAGLGWYGYFSQMPWDVAAQILTVNVVSAAHLARLCLPGMCARGLGRVINVGSISGSLPSQGIAIYGSSKAFLDNFTSALQRELRGTGVTASVVRLGPVDTEFYAVSAAHPASSLFPAGQFSISAARAADGLYRLLDRPRRVVYLPAVLAAAPWLELCFGWLIDRLGPLLLKRRQSPQKQHLTGP